MTCIHNQLKHTKILPSEVRLFRDACSAPPGSNTKEIIKSGSLQRDGAMFRCKKCRIILASQACVLPHYPGSGNINWTDFISFNRVDYPCKQGIFLEPLKWMSNAFVEMSDRLLCAKCGHKLGSFSWNDSVSCGCSKKMLPGFWINMARVDKCTMLKEVEADL